MAAGFDAMDAGILEEMREDLELDLAEFPRAMRARGLEYANRRLVKDLHRVQRSIRARVRGGAMYSVVWKWSEDEGWDGSCTCPVAVSCKHLYAAGLLALSDPFVLGLAHVTPPASITPLRQAAPTTRRTPGRARAAPVDPSNDPLRRLREESEPWRREAALSELLGYDRMNRLRLGARRALLEGLMDEDPDARCWKVVRAIESLADMPVPAKLVPYADRPELEARAAEVERRRLLAGVVDWSLSGALREGTRTKRLRVVFRLAHEAGEAVVQVEARLSSARLQDVPRRIEQLEQLLGECRADPNVLAPAEVLLLQGLVTARAGDLGGPPLSHQPSVLRRLVERLHDSPLASWDPEGDAALMTRAGVSSGGRVRLGAALASFVPACEERDGGLVLGLRVAFSDGRERSLQEVIHCGQTLGGERRGDSLVLADGVFWPSVGEPSAALLGQFAAQGGVPVHLESDGPLLRALGQRFPSVARGLASRTRPFRVAPLALVDVVDDTWLQVRLLARAGTSSWDPTQPSEPGVATFELDRHAGFVPVTLVPTDSPDHLPEDAGEAGVLLTDAEGFLLEPAAEDLALGRAWLDPVLADEAAPTPERYRGWPGHWLRATSSSLERLADAAMDSDRRIPVYVGRALQNLLDPSKRPRPRVRVKASGIDFFEISAEWAADALALTVPEIAALRGGTGRFVRLPRGWVPREWAEEQEAVLAALSDLGVEPGSGPDLIGLTQLAGASTKSLEVLAACGMSPQSSAAVEKLRATIAAFEGVPRVPLPEGLTAELRPYQRDGLDFLAHASTLGLGAVLADDMGLGKTVQALAWLLHLRLREPHGGPSLVICPTSLLHGWRREAERFAPGLRVAVLERGEDRHALRNDAAAYDLLVTNYALLRRDIEAWEKLELRAAILDEAQQVKNPDAEISKAVRRLRARHRLALTGTPLENRPLDLWSLLAFVNPGLLGSQRVFSARYEGPEASPLGRTALTAKLRPVLLRRLKRDVAKDLPDRIEERRDCELSTEQRKLYLAELRRTRSLALAPKGAAQDEAKRRIAVLAALTRLRQICCHAALAGGQRSTASGKVDALFEILEPLLAEGHKVLVFSQFVRCLEILREELRERDISHHLLTGKSVKRDRIVADFEAEEGASVFLVSLKAGGTGLNLTAASYVVLFDPWWNPAVEAQAIDRTHRIGQRRTVVAYRLLARGTVEERIFELQQRKSQMVRDVLGEEGFARSLTREDFAYLLDGA